MNNKYQVIVVGAGHSGMEAAHISAKLGKKTLLITHNIDSIGQLSCNPSIGGIGKSHLVKEIDALGGIMALVTDHAAIQYRILNKSKGPAVRATRAQVDRELYKKKCLSVLLKTKNLFIFQQPVANILISNNIVAGIVTETGLEFYAAKVIITAGTFLNGKIFISDTVMSAGRAGDPASITFGNNLYKHGLKSYRLKTGTPPRLDKRTVNLSILEEQKTESELPNMSFWNKDNFHIKQVDCYITNTNKTTHQIIQENVDKSAIYNGNIKSSGPRYCPSIEDKIVRFADKKSHQIFVEPEGLNSFELYPNGISTSLPFNVQQQFVNSIKGFENAFITRPGYAIEYDYFDPCNLKKTMESKIIKSLYMAGQINGTTGYEEAAAQGIIAGINASLSIDNKSSINLTRENSYIGVMLDDLTTKGIIEPYRMFTSRAEHRLILRQDNAIDRLAPIAKMIGSISESQYNKYLQRKQETIEELSKIRKTFIHPDTKKSKQLEQITNEKLKHEYSLSNLLKRPEININHLTNFYQANKNQDILEQIEINIKYEGYIKRQNQEISNIEKNYKMLLKDNIDYFSIPGISTEIAQRLAALKPNNIGEASKIYGMTPSAIAILIIYIKKNRYKNE